MRFHRMFLFVVGLAICLATASVAAQLGSRPAEDWIKTLDGPVRVAGMKIDEVVSALKLQPGQTVADIGAGSGLLDVPLAKAVGPRGRSPRLDRRWLFLRSASAPPKRVIETILGKFTVRLTGQVRRRPATSSITSRIAAAIQRRLGRLAASSSTTKVAKDCTARSLSSSHARATQLDEGRGVRPGRSVKLF